MMERVSMDGRPRRREYSREFKDAGLQETRQSGESVAGVALKHSLNPNMVHGWLSEERQRQELAQLLSPESAFLPLQLTPPTEWAPPSRLPTDLPVDKAKSSALSSKGADTSLGVSWPFSAAAQ